MQTSAPELMDISRETAATLHEYGAAAGDTKSFAAQCLTARRLIERYYTAEQIARTWPSWEARAASWVTVRVAPARVRSSGL